MWKKSASISVICLFLQFYCQETVLAQSKKIRQPTVISESDLALDLQEALKKAKVQLNIAFLISKKAEARNKPILLIEKSDETYTEDTRELIDHEKIFMKKVTAQAFIGLRAARFAAKGLAALLTLYQGKKLIQFESYRVQKTDEYLAERQIQEEKGLLGNSILEELENDQLLLYGSLFYSLYVSTGHFLKNSFGNEYWYPFAFPLEGAGLWSERQNASEQILQALQENSEEKALYGFELDSLYFETTLQELKKKGYREAILPKFQTLFYDIEEE